MNPIIYFIKIAIGAIINIINQIISILGQLIGLVMQLLPNSPFRDSINNMTRDDSLLAVANYILPIDSAIVILSFWVTAVGVYYMYRIILNWVKVDS